MIHQNNLPNRNVDNPDDQETYQHPPIIGTIYRLPGTILFIPDLPHFGQQVADQRNTNLQDLTGQRIDQIIIHPKEQLERKILIIYWFILILYLVVLYLCWSLFIFLLVIYQSIANDHRPRVNRPPPQSLHLQLYGLEHNAQAENRTAQATDDEIQFPTPFDNVVPYSIETALTPNRPTTDTIANNDAIINPNIPLKTTPPVTVLEDTDPNEQRSRTLSVVENKVETDPSNVVDCQPDTLNNEVVKNEAVVATSTDLTEQVVASLICPIFDVPLTI